MANAHEGSAGDGSRPRVWRWVRKWGVALAIAVALGFSIRAVVAEEFRAMTGAVAPEVPKGARVLVYKLASQYRADDLLVYRDAKGHALLARVVGVDARGGTITVSRNREAARQVPLDRVVGRVVVATR